MSGGRSRRALGPTDLLGSPGRGGRAICGRRGPISGAGAGRRPALRAADAIRDSGDQRGAPPSRGPVMRPV